MVPRYLVEAGCQATAGSRALPPSADRVSGVIFCPSISPSSRRPRWKAPMFVSSVLGLRKAPGDRPPLWSRHHRSRRRAAENGYERATPHAQRSCGLGVELRLQQL